MARTKKKDKVAELEQEVEALRERFHEAAKHVVKIITFSPLALPPTSPGKKTNLQRTVEKQKQLAVRALLDLEPEHRKAQEFVEKYGSPDGS